MKHSIAKHEQRKKRGEEHIDRDISEIVQIMEGREAEEQARAAAAAVPAPAAPAAPAAPQLAPAMPTLIESPDGSLQGVLSAGRVGWTAKSTIAPWQLAQDENLGWGISF